MEAHRRELRIVAAAIAISAIGDWVAVLALALRAGEMWAGAGVSVLLIAAWAPAALLSGHVGVVVDRFETRRVAILAAVWQCTMVVALSFATDSIAALLVLTALLGAGGAVGIAAEFALVPRLAAGRELARANGLVESARTLGFVGGPLAGGALAATAGTRWALLLDAATFVVIAVALATVSVRRVPVAAAAGAARARDGMKALFADATLAPAMAAGAATLLFMSASIPGDFVYTRDDLGRSGLALGLVLTVWAIGMVVAASTVPQRVPLHAVATVALLAASLQGASKFAAPFWQVLPFMVACYAVGGISHGVKNTLFRTLIHIHVPDGQHGRAFAAYNGLRNGAELVALALGGVLTATLGGSGTLWLAGGAAAVAGLAGAVVVAGRESPAAADVRSDA